MRAFGFVWRGTYLSLGQCKVPSTDSTVQKLQATLDGLTAQLNGGA